MQLLYSTVKVVNVLILSSSKQALHIVISPRSVIVFPAFFVRMIRGDNNYFSSVISYNNMKCSVFLNINPKD